MDIKERIEKLEDEVFKVEMKEFLKENRREISCTPKKAAPKSKNSFTLHQTRLPGGGWRHEVKRANGEKIILSDDRSKWPKDVRFVIEKCEAADKSRTVNGRLMGCVGGTARLS